MMNDTLTAEDGENLYNRFLTNPHGERYLYAINGQAFAQCSSSVVYQTHFGDELSCENTLYVIVGTDGGLLPEYLSRQPLPPGTRYVCIELPEFLPVIKARLEDTPMPEAILLCTTDEWLQVLQDNELAEYAYRSAVVLSQSLAVADNCYIAYRPTWRTIDAELRQLLWEYGVQLSSRVFIRRQIENLTENMIPAAYLRDRFKGLTAAVLAGGPSLTKHLPWIIEHRDRIAVIAVSRISRLLQATGITPDIVVSVDPNPISFDVSREMLDFSSTLLVNGYHITPMLLGNYRGPSVYTDSALPWAEPGDNIKSVGPTVTNTAIHLAQDMGFAQIVLLGVDLCYSPEGFTHALGSIEHAAGPVVGYIGQTVATNAGDRAETDPPFLHATKALTLQAERAAQLRCTLVNPAPGAAAIIGVVHCPLDDLNILPPLTPIHDILTQCLPPTSPEQRLAHYANCRKEVDRARYKVARIIRLSQKALQLNERLFRQRDQRLKLKLDRLERDLDAPGLMRYSRLCKIFGSERFAQLLTPGNAESWSDQFINTNGRDYYQAYLYGARTFDRVLEEAADRIAVRVSELSDVPDWRRIGDQWRRDNQTGRCLLHTATAETSDKLPEELRQELLTAFRQQLASTDARHLKTCMQRSRLQGVIGKANECLDNKDVQGLTRLMTGLALRSEPEAKPLAALCAGYVAEIKNDSDAAVAAYGQIEAGPAIEYALVRITGLALAREDFASARIAMENLTTYSLAYAPQYAELLRITGATDQAITVYTDYLTVVPNDLVAMTRLGLLYQTLGIEEGVRWITTHLAEKSPTPTMAATATSLLIPAQR